LVKANKIIDAAKKLNVLDLNDKILKEIYKNIEKFKKSGQKGGRDKSSTGTGRNYLYSMICQGLRNYCEDNKKRIKTTDNSRFSVSLEVPSVTIEEDTDASIIDGTDILIEV
jgi:hypothetical protein